MLKVESRYLEPVKQNTNKSMLFGEKMGIGYQCDSALKDKCSLTLAVLCKTGLG